MALNLSMDGCMNHINHKLREKENNRTEERRRNILYLIADYLKQHGLTDSYNTLFTEAQLSSNVQVCDNIDLEMILVEYNSFYHIKFNKQPTLLKTVESKSCANQTHVKKNNKTISKSIKNDTSKENTTQRTNSGPEEDINFGLTVSQLFPVDNVNDNENLTNNLPNNRPTRLKILKCIEKLYPNDSELRKIAEDISMEIVMNDLNVHWDDVIGLDKCKTVIKEAVVYPLKYPIFFSDKFSPWKGILLYGPPGTGKTMLAKAAATECNCTFINVTASLLVSKWRGDSEKYIRVLFDLAYNQSPTIIFIDEIDWISTNNNDSLSEPAKRFRAELLGRLDGLTSPESANVVLLAATNAPWSIDSALLRRLEKKILVTLPDVTARLDLFKLYVSPDLLKHEKYRKSLIDSTENYSAAEIKLICKTAWMHESAMTWNLLERDEINVTNLKFEITDRQSLNRAIEEDIQAMDKNMSKYLDWMVCPNTSSYN